LIPTRQGPTVPAPGQAADLPHEVAQQEIDLDRVAGVRTTREAAAALFLSPKTVGYHLRKDL